MRKIHVAALGLSASLLAGNLAAEDGWQPLRARVPDREAPVAALARPIAVATPIPSGTRARGVAEEPISRVSYNDDPLKGPIALAAPQAPPPQPRLGIPYTSNNPPPPVPPPGEEQYNSGVLTDPAAPGNGGKGFLGGFPWFDLNLTAGGRKKFESDHAFDNFVSPITSPFFAEDPRALTELRPIFLWQTVPSGQPAYRGGDIFFFGTQARVALTDQLSFVIHKLGWVSNDPGNPIPGFSSDSGFAELHFGPKFTFWRNDQSGTLMAAGLNFQVPAGSSKVFQDTGNLSVVPYLSFGQNLRFLPQGWGSFNFMSTLGYAFGTDDRRTDYFFSTYHLDYDLGGLRKIYPMIELTWVNYTGSGNARNLNFEGRDLFNFGSTGASGNTVTMAAGLRYKFNESIQVGGAAEFPIAGQRDLFDFRLTMDLIFRF